MAETTLVFDVLAKDRASRTLDDVGRRSNALGRNLGRLAGIAAGVGIVGGVTMLTGFIKDAQESAKVTRITEQVIKSTGGAAKVTAAQVGDLSEALSNKTAVDDELVQTGANLLLTFKNIRNETGKGNDIFNQATEAALNLSAAGFGSVDSAAKMLGKALNDPIAGLTALGRAGVTFTEQQKEQIRTLVEAGDVLGAQRIIMEEVASQVGGAAEAAADPMERLKTIAGNLGEEIGTALLPYLEDFATWLTEEGVPKVEAMITTFRDEWIPVIEDVVEWVKENKEVIVSLVTAVGTIVVATKLWTAAQWGLNVAMGANPLGAFLIIVGAVTAALIRVRLITGSWRRTLEGLALYVKNIPGFGPLLSLLTNIANTISRIRLGWIALKRVLEKGVGTIPGLGSIFGGSGGKEGGRLSAADIVGARAFPLPRGTYRWGRGPAGHGYDAQDLPVPTGTPVFAPVSGFARGIDLGNRSYGKYVQIASSFGRVILAHLSRLGIGSGYVRAGQMIGLSGSTGNSTGPHLHVEPSGILKFDVGGWLPTGLSLAYNGTGRPERILGPRDSAAVMNGENGGRVVLEIHSGGSRLDDLLVQVLTRAVRIRGGDVQMVLGS